MYEILLLQDLPYNKASEEIRGGRKVVSMCVVQTALNAKLQLCDIKLHLNEVIQMPFVPGKRSQSAQL